MKVEPPLSLKLGTGLTTYTTAILFLSYLEVVFAGHDLIELLPVLVLLQLWRLHLIQELEVVEALAVPEAGLHQTYLLLTGLQAQKGQALSELVAGDVTYMVPAHVDAWGLSVHAQL